MNDIQAGVDNTDHIAFFCPECGNIMDINNVTIQGTDNCICIYLHCSQCNTEGQHKMYLT